MKSLTLSLQVFAAVVGLMGCATGPSYSEYSATLPAVQQDQGRIWFYRPSKMLGAAIQPQVKLNDVPVGKAQPGSFFHVERPAGGYEVECTTEWSHKCQINVDKNSVTFVRLTISPGVFVGHVVPSQVVREKALKEIAKCRLLTADGANAKVAANASK